MTTPDVIQRYVAWCKRHHLDPLQKKHFYLYWNVTPPQQVAGVSVSASFSNVNLALLETRFGPSLGSLGEPAGNQVRIKDTWWLVVEWMADDTDFLEGRENFSHSYDEWGEPISHTPGRILKRQLLFEADSSLTNWSFGPSPSTTLKTSYKISPPWNVRSTARVEIVSRDEYTLERALLDVGYFMMSTWKERPRQLRVKAQRYTYRSYQAREQHESRRESQEYRRYRSKQRRLARRREERENANT